MQTATLPTQSRPPYLLGLLCLMPLLGAFVGVILLILGIVKYKDKWLTIIGVLGIVLTVGIYSFLFYYMKNGDLSKKGFADISQMQLNSLVKNIEFYNIQHGQYPDNLQQLLQDDKLAPIEDAIQMVQQRPVTTYHYQRIGNKYILFSSGQDGIPNNGDDLLPQIAVDDSTRVGLIQPH